MTLKEMATRPELWPLVHALPVARRGGLLIPEVGVILAGGGPVVFLDVCVAEPDLRGQVAAAERKVYYTFDDLERDWRLD